MSTDDVAEIKKARTFARSFNDRTMYGLDLILLTSLFQDQFRYSFGILRATPVSMAARMTASLTALTTSWLNTEGMM